MKLQIMTKLQQYEPKKLDLDRALKLDGVETEQRVLTRKSNSTSQCESVKNIEKIKKFFINFNNQTITKHEKVQYLSIGVKRKLQPQLAALLSLKQKQYKDTYVSTSTFAFPEQTKKLTLNIKSISNDRTTDSSKQNSVRPNYYCQVRPKQKVRKITSLINIKREESIEEQKRRPGFIRSNSSVNRQAYSSVNTSSNKQNYDPNEKVLKRTGSRVFTAQNEEGVGLFKEAKQRIGSVDQEIVDAKQRIAKIRRQLNQRYDMRKANSNRLKLF